MKPTANAVRLGDERSLEAKALPMSRKLLAQLVDQRRRFLKFLEPRVGSRVDAEELLQVAFLKSLERGGETREGESAETEAVAT